jgi:hypothetical protein
LKITTTDISNFLTKVNSHFILKEFNNLKKFLFNNSFLGRTKVKESLLYIELTNMIQVLKEIEQKYYLISSLSVNSSTLFTIPVTVKKQKLEKVEKDEDIKTILNIDFDEKLHHHIFGQVNMMNFR